MVAEIDTGARNLTGWKVSLIPTICSHLGAYQLYTASTIPSMLTEYLGIDFFYSSPTFRFRARCTWRLPSC